MEVRHLPTPEHFERMNTQEVREHFLIQELYVPGEVKLVYSHVDRMIIGGAVPGETGLTLPAGKELAADYFAERREIGVINIGSAGSIRVDDETYIMNNSDMLYIGRGSKDIALCSDNPDDPARYYLVSLPAHAPYPTTRATINEANKIDLGSQSDANTRTIYQYIHEGGVQSCQLVMGFTALEDGNVWNTMPAHTHERRSEAYMYFDLEPDAVVFHLMGAPKETRHIVIRDGEAAISPSWSIHAGSGTKRYKFVWAMGGENQEFDDMDFIPMSELA
ncbi:MAG: 5-dehydro-4-deoxy-D-glucuronate isomerase [Chloroflexi bacterium]|nr:MAG: 5-dehydro-4-deoxy-D-glucuronate isomerase [Chloroflexota bacterium]